MIPFGFCFYALSGKLDRLSNLCVQDGASMIHLMEFNDWSKSELSDICCVIRAQFVKRGFSALMQHPREWIRVERGFIAFVQTRRYGLDLCESLRCLFPAVGLLGRDSSGHREMSSSANCEPHVIEPSA